MTLEKHTTGALKGLYVIPEELTKKGVRWVEVCDSEGVAWEKRIFIGINYGSSYLIRAVEDKHEERFIKGERRDGSVIIGYRKMREIEEPKKIPYTEKTFPLWAVWIRIKEVGVIYSVKCITEEYIEMDHGEFSYKGAKYADMDKYEIAGTEERDGKMWHPFYREEK